MAADLDTVLDNVEAAARQIFAADPTVRSVGVGKSMGGHGFVAVRNVRAIMPLLSTVGAPPPLRDFDGIPIAYASSEMDPVHFARIAHSGPRATRLEAAMPEQQSHLPLVCGLQIQNYDDDVRTGEIDKGYIIIGTLGCFVKMEGGQPAVVSNNHVLAGENRGLIGDRICQPGVAAMTGANEVATLTRFVPLQPSPAGGTIANGTAVLNEVDAALAGLHDAAAFKQAYLPGRQAPSPRGIAMPALGDKVHKVGRTTGLTFGTVTQIGTLVGPIGYAPGACWFRNSFTIESDNGSTFSDHGDSGSVIVRSDGMAVGLLYAGNRTQTYACLIGNAMAALNCQLA